MKYRLFLESRLFTRTVKDYLSDDEYAALQEHLLENPTAGPVVTNSGGVRKLRWGTRGKGKSGGIRVIYSIHDDVSFRMLTIYRKGEVDSIPGPALRRIKEAMSNG